MSRRSEHARTVVACGVLLGALELLSIAAAARWSTVDDPPAQWQRASAAESATDTPVRAANAADGDGGDETQASLLFGQQVLARIDGALDAARIGLARPALARAPYERFCPVAHACD